MKSFCLLALSFGGLMLLVLQSCNTRGPVPEYDVTGLRVETSIKRGGPYSSAYDTTFALVPKGVNVFLFADDGYFKWFVRRGGMSLHMAGTFRTSRDSLYLKGDTSELVFTIHRYSSGEHIIFAWDETRGGGGREEDMFFLVTRELRRNRSLVSHFGQNNVDRYGLAIPDSRLLRNPDEIDVGLYAGERIGVEAGDTIRYGCLWDVRTDSTIVEYLMNGRARTKRTYAYDVAWAPGDVYDTLVLRANQPAERRLRLYETSPYLSAWNTGADGYRLTSAQYDEQAARDARQMLAFDGYVEE